MNKMKIHDSLEEFTHLDLPKPIVTTIGFFDGVHRGHQAIFQRLHQIAHPAGTTIAISFIDHPSLILRPNTPVSLLCSQRHKQHLFEHQHIDHLLLIPFTKDFAAQTSEQFLNQLRHHLKFDEMVLGHDAVLGKNREGTPDRLRMIAKELHFTIDYLTALTDMNGPISSTRIRQLVREGKLHDAATLLGRPFSILSTVQPGDGRGKHLGFHTANVDVANLCLPPLGVYAVTIKFDGTEIAGIANLGVAPTLKQISTPQLEVHLFDFNRDLYGQDIEVIFHEFIRPEHRFNTIEELQIQIGKDILQAKEALRNKLM